MQSISVEAILSARDQNFTSTMNKALGTTQSLGSKLKSGIGFGAFMAIGSKAVNAVTNGIRNMTGSMGDAVKRVDTLNNFPKIMKNLGYSTTDASKAMNILDKGIDGLPTSMDAIVGATQKIAPLTGNLGDAAKVSVALNNALLAGGKSTETQANALEQYSQMLAAGKVDMQAWRSMLDAMPGQLDQVAASLLGAGHNQKALYDAMKDGTVTFDDFNNELLKLNKEGVNGLASFEEQAKTATQGIGTAVQNIQTAFVKGKANIINAIDTMLTKNGLPTIAGMLNNLKPSINSFFNNFRDKIVDINLKEFAAQIGAVGTAFGLAFGAFNIGGLSKQFSVLTAAMKALGGKAKIALSGVASHFSTLGSAIGNQVAIMSMHVSQAFGGLGMVVQGALGKAFGGAAAVISTSLGAASKVAAIGLKALVPAVGIAAVIAGLGLLYTKYQSEIDKLLVTMRAKGPEIIRSFGESIVSQIPTLMQKGTQLITGFLTAVTANIPQLLTTGVQILQSLINGLMTAMPQLLTSAAQFISTLVIGIGSALPQLITMGVQVLASFISGISQQLPMLVESAFQALSQFVQGIMDNLPTILQAGVVAVQNLVQGITQSIPQIIQGGIQLIMQFAQGILSNLPAILNAGIQIIITLAGGLIQAIPQILAAIPQLVSAIADGIMSTDWIKVGADIIKAIGSGITSAGKGLWNNIKGLFGGKTGGGQKATKDSGKTTGTTYTTSAASSIKATSSKVNAATKSTATGAVKSFDSSSKGAGKGFATSLKTNLKGADSASKSAGQSAGKGYASGLKSGLNSANSSAKSTVNKISSTLKSGVGKARSVGAQIGNGIASGISAAQGRVTASCNAMIAKINEVLRKKAEVHSPSRMTKRIGKFITKGLAVGMSEGITGLSKTAKQLVSTIKTALEKETGKGTWQKSFDETASSIADSMKNALESKANSISSAFTKKLDKIFNQAHKKLSKKQKKNKKFQKAFENLKKTLNKDYASAINKATSKAVSSAENQLNKLGEAFQTKYESIVSAKDAFVSNMRSYGSLFQEVEAEYDKYGFLTKAGGVSLFDFTTEEKKIKEIDKSLRTIQNWGVSRDFLDQITGLSNTNDQKKVLDELIKMGAEGAKAYASSFDNYWKTTQTIGSDLYKPYVDQLNNEYKTESVKVLNSLKAELNAVGKNAAKGLVDGIKDKKTKKALKAAAGRLANSIISTIKKKLKIHSPSKVMESLGAFTGEGFANGLEEVKRDVANAMSDIVSIPQQMTPAFAGNMGMSEDYNYGAHFEGEIIVPVDLDGRQIAEVSAPFTEDILNRRQIRENRKVGRR